MQKHANLTQAVFDKGNAVARDVASGVDLLGYRSPVSIKSSKRSLKACFIPERTSFGSRLAKETRPLGTPQRGEKGREWLHLYAGVHRCLASRELGTHLHRMLSPNSANKS